VNGTGTKKGSIIK